MRRTLLALLVLLGIGVVVSRFVPKIAAITVTGNVHHDYQRVLRLAAVQVGDPLLWVTRSSIAGLALDPWVHSVAVVRSWPDALHISLTERRAALTDGSTTWALDGTVLTGASQVETASLPMLNGWGSARTTEALELLRLLGPYEPQVISYSPEGFEIQLTGTTLFTPSAEALRHHWSAFIDQRGKRVSVYPWGVSSSDE